MLRGKHGKWVYVLCSYNPRRTAPDVLRVAQFSDLTNEEAAIRHFHAELVSGDYFLVKIQERRSSEMLDWVAQTEQERK